MPDPNMSANPAKARRVIEFIKRPENAGMNNRDVAYALGINESYVRRAKSVFKLGKTMKISPKKLRMDGGTQPREKIDDAVVKEYAEVWTSGGIFPPPDVFYDGSEYWLADGFHRVIAAIRAGIKRIDVEVHQGECRDAVLFSVGVNATHGVRRTNEDKRRAVMTLLNDEEWSHWSDVKIAARCGVTDKTVARYRPESILGNSEDRKTRTAERDGKQYPIKTPGLGRKTKTQPESNPEVTETETDATPDEPAKVPPVESNGVHEKNGSEIARIPTTPEPTTEPVKGPDPAPQADTPKPVDPPDIAAQRAKGLIPSDAKVEVTEPDPADEDEPPDVQAEQTDEEWLADLSEAFSVREKLSPYCRRHFDDAALIYRHTEEFRGRFRKDCKPVVETFRSPGFPNSMASKFNWVFGWKHPRHWVVCGDCKGSGQNPPIGKCPTCHGEGYHS
jgi:hypothetical protein